MNPVTYLREVKGELEKVVWPKRNHVVKLTLTVLLVSVIVGAYIGTLDFTLTKVLETLLVK